MTQPLYLHEPHKRPGSFIPLFERLVDFNIETLNERPVQKFYDCEGMQQSIQRELLHLLGTYVKFKKDEYGCLSKNAFNYSLPGMYGVPEFSLFEGTNAYNWRSFSRNLEIIIARFEPRLHAINVTIQGVDNNKQYLNISIAASLNKPYFQEEFTFPINVKLSVHYTNFI